MAFLYHKFDKGTIPPSAPRKPLLSKDKRGFLFYIQIILQRKSNGALLGENQAAVW